jgi:hypothetical protein
MPSFPAGALTPPPSSSVAVPRYLGGIALNDRVNTFFDRLEVAGTRTVQVEPLYNHGGDVVVVKVDRKGLVAGVYGVWMDGGGRQWEDFVRQLEDGGVAVPFTLGDGTQYDVCWAQELAGTQVGIIAIGPPVRRVLRWSFKLVSRHTYRSAVP